MCCLDIWNWMGGGAWWLNCRSPPPQILFPGIRYTGPSPSLSQGQAQCCLSLNSGLLQFLASVQNYSDKSVTPPCRSQGSPHPLVSMELVSHRPCLFTLFLGVAPRQLCMVCTCSLRLWVYGAVKLLSISSVQCQVSCIPPSLSP